MDALKILGVILVILGVAALAYGGFTYTEETHKADLGPLEIKVEDKERVNIPVWAGVGMVAAGVGCLLFGKKSLVPGTR